MATATKVLYEPERAIDHLVHEVLIPLGLAKQGEKIPYDKLVQLIDKLKDMAEEK